jgi:hypothetical protein
MASAIIVPTRLNGGTVSNRVDPKDWGNHLSVTADSITFLFKDGQRSEINPKSVTSLSYGQEAHPDFLWISRLNLWS